MNQNGFGRISDRDTAIGQDKDASYRINIEVNSVVVEE